MFIVESFPLSRPIETNNFYGVNFYLDEVGQLKHLSTNNRAVALANSCGLLNVPLVGDMYIGKICCKPYSDGIINDNFFLNDLNSDALWLQNIQKDNYEFGIKTNRIAMPGDISDAPIIIDNNTKGYKWSETDDNIEINYKLPENFTSKTIKIIINTKSIKIQSKIDNKFILELTLYKNISIDDSTWTCNNNEIEFTLEKSTNGMWNQLEVEIE